MSKTKILADLWVVTEHQESWGKFRQWANIGLPLALAVESGMATLTESGQAIIDETYNMLLAVMELDEADEYEDLKAIFDAATESDEE